jgi:hypothetical protein
LLHPVKKNDKRNDTEGKEALNRIKVMKPTKTPLASSPKFVGELP